MRLRRPGGRWGYRFFVPLVVIGLVIPFVSVFFPAQASAASLTVASDVSEIAENTTSTTYVATDTSIASGSLPAGTYLVAWGAGVGNSINSEIATARLVRGSTEIGVSGSEANGGGAANNGRSPAGFWLGTLSGSEALTIEFKISVGTATAYIDSKFIKAVRLDDKLVENVDYYTTGPQEDGADEATNVSTSGLTTIKSLTKTFHASGSQNYIMLASMEISPDSTANDCIAQLTVDGTAVTTQTGEGEDVADIYNYLAVDVRTLGSGSKTISLEGQSVGSATCDFMRSRIYVLRANIFDQVVENESLSESTLASTTWTDKNSITYTPNQSEDVMVLINQLSGSSSTASPLSTRIYNSTDATAHADTKSHAVNNATADYYSGMSAASFSISTAKTFKSQFQRPTGTGTVKIKDSRLVVWSMTLKAGSKQKLSVVGTSLAPTDLSASTSTTYVDTNATIAASSLPAGKYLVVWGARPSSSDANEISWVQLVRGSTTLAEKGSEANGQIWAGGYWLGDLDGTEALKIQQKTSLGTATSNVRTKFIKAIRLDEYMYENSDYYTTGPQESASDEVTDASTSSWTTVKSLTKSFHPATTQNYIVLADMEVSNDDVSYECEARLTVDGTSTNTQTLDGEDVDDISGYVVADLASIGTGSKTISLEGKSVESAKCDFRRSRIYVFRANIFDQVAENESLTESTTTSVGTWVDKTSLTYTPNQSEDVLLLASHMLSADNSGTVTAIGIYNSTDATMLAGPMTHIMNAPTGNYGSIMTADMVNISTAKTYKGQFQMQSGSTTSRTKDARLIAWSMTLKVPQMTQASYRLFSGSPWWDSDWGARRKITFDNSASSEALTNFPVRVSLSSSNINYSKTQNSGQDVRFVDSDGTLLKHEIEVWNESGTSEVWVNVPQIDAGSTSDYIWVYYDNATVADGQDAQNTWASGHKGVWNLNQDPSGGAPQMTDSTSSNLDGTTGGTMTSGQKVTAKVASGTSFDATDDYISAGNPSTAIGTDTQGAVSLWFSRTTTDTSKALFSIGSTGSVNDVFSMMFTSSNTLEVLVKGSATSYIRFSVDLGSSASNGSWNHVVFTVGPSGNALYYNGAPQTVTYTDGSASTTNWLSSVTGKNYLYIGARDVGTLGSFFNGSIDQVQITNTVRSAEWAEAEYVSQGNTMNSFASEELSTSSYLTALAAQNTAATVTTGTSFLMRQIFEQTQGTTALATYLKLQYAEKSGTCDTSFSGETYADVPTSGTVLAYYNGASANQTAFSTIADDPTSSNSILNQYAVESNPFANGRNSLATGYAGMWQFSLVAGNDAAGKTYCLRTIYYNTITLNSYSQVGEVAVVSGGPTLDQQMRHGRGVINGVETPLN